ncbi:DUF3397 domain-containing protein [Virgibacillus necropolis]|uniref:DUF3397 domain-containing protein n=1 Tax=Virgibacillus necropolis TaxID=163877 RepID=A0A221ME30_9BACI|nr:DUF3397 domain-containing protein [Virgibacillus necropolis]ASN05860.1 hypothetical protein CFK40_12980 [Virgibacillus necropolis]
MWSIITYSIAIAITIPFVMTWLVYKCNRIFKKTRVYAFHKAITWTTILYILSVMTMCKILFDHFFIGYISVFHLLFLAIIIIYQRVNYTEVVLKKACKIVWRVSFLLFSFLYILLILFGIIQRFFTL